MFGGKRMNDKATQESQETEIAVGPPLPPRADLASEDGPDIRLKQPTAMEVFFAWEKLRLAYNALLAVTGIGMMILKAEFSPLIVVFAAGPILLANLCFCVGPVAEGYLCWFGLPRRPVRWIIFGLGLLIALGYTVEGMESILKQAAVDR
jgi:hypothetical protein